MAKKLLAFIESKDLLLPHYSSIHPHVIFSESFSVLFSPIYVYVSSLCMYFSFSPCIQGSPVDGTAAAYSWSPRFKSRSGDRLFWHFSQFSSVLQVCRDSTLNKVTTASFHILYSSSFTYLPFIRRYRPTEVIKLNWCIQYILLDFISKLIFGG
jgi:hypothetical protein